MGVITRGVPYLDLWLSVFVVGVRCVAFCLVLCGVAHVDIAGLCYTVCVCVRRRSLRHVGAAGFGVC